MYELSQDRFTALVAAFIYLLAALAFTVHKALAKLHRRVAHPAPERQFTGGDAGDDHNYV